MIEGGTLTSDTVGSASAACPAGTVVLGGGYQIDFVDDDASGWPDVDVFWNYPIGGQRGWRAAALNNENEDLLLTVFALCAAVD